MKFLASSRMKVAFPKVEKFYGKDILISLCSFSIKYNKNLFECMEKWSSYTKESTSYHNWIFITLPVKSRINTLINIYELDIHLKFAIFFRVTNWYLCDSHGGRFYGFVQINDLLYLKSLLTTPLPASSCNSSGYVSRD